MIVSINTGFKLPMLLPIFLFYSCTEKKEQYRYVENEVSTSAATKSCSISNPYSSGSGHYAGFEWAERKGVTSCGGNNSSFIGGCEEFLSQVSRCN